jgi:hypothetical protein
MKSATLKAHIVPSISAGSLAGNPPTHEMEIRAIIPGLSELKETAFQDDILIIPDNIPLTPTRRLVVVTPAGEVNENKLARRVWQLAAGSNLDVLYVGQASDDLQITLQRRRLVGLTSKTTNGKVHARLKITTEKNWQKTFTAICEPGDILVFLENHRTRSRILRRKPLGEALAISAPVPVYLMSGLKVGQSPYVRHQEIEILAWIVMLMMLMAFTALQIAIDRSTSGAISTLLLCMSVLFEIYLLWKINEGIR